MNNNFDNAERHHLLSSLKHDLNNVLTGVKTGLEIMAMDDYFEDPENAEDLKDVIKASTKLAHMLDDLSFIFADIPEAKIPVQKLSTEEILSELIQHLDCHNLKIDIAVTDCSFIKGQKNYLIRGLYHAVAFASTQKSDVPTLQLSQDEDISTWAIPLRPEVFKILKENVLDSNNHHNAMNAKLSKLAILKMGGSWELNAKGQGGEIRIVL